MLTFNGLPLVAITLFCGTIIIVISKLLKPKKDLGYQKVKDLIRGTIIVNSLDELKDAYEHLCTLPGIVIVDIKDKLTTLENITVNFIHNDEMIGEM